MLTLRKTGDAKPRFGNCNCPIFLNKKKEKKKYKNMLLKLGFEHTINVRLEPSFVRSKPSFFHFDIRDIYKYSLVLIFLSYNQYMEQYGINVMSNNLYYRQHIKGAMHKNRAAPSTTAVHP